MVLEIYYKLRNFNNKVVLLMFTYCYTSYGQLPSQDSSYTMVFNDEFNSTSLDNSKWETNVPWGNYYYKLNCNNPNPDTLFFVDYFTAGNNLQFTGTSVKLIAKHEKYPAQYIKGWYKSYNPGCATACNPAWANCINDSCILPIVLTDTFQYTTARLWSKKKFKYGYFEIRVRIPDPPTLPSTFQGHSTNFWLFNSDNNIYISELDIYEIRSSNNIWSNNIHYRRKNYQVEQTDYVEYPSTSSPSPVLFNNQFRVFSANWTPEKIEFYLDGIYFRTCTLMKQDSLISMPMIVDIGTGFNQFCEPVDTANTVFPYETEIDYIRVYQQRSDCNTSKSYCGNISTHDYKTYKDITIDGSSCSDLVNNKANESYTANDYLLLDQGFEIGNNYTGRFEVIKCFSGQELNNSRIANPPLFEPAPQAWLDRLNFKNK